ncbi:MAG TPA: hypothetical protein DCQ26_00750 [Marinilabiliales bacterium]|jgi:hypothetical protein|nr:hypothetical protein [Salinivirgaceae bacterium]OFX48035.1 MAG: hypothetical protein A2W95_17395 [Bacteroidetes bacterium GWA2_40_14]OFX57010.1 MAG: hypothetical protein A2W84_11885 [Bacteroidetes bacterium GWC2_40_13]OFX74883.1 MAG: hypothetical protein A2W96_02030 [Bacteroidetes bacterium GWD2_40_43]OFX93426.1 MAG: hypothetical protein A2W97_15360 [Bacteroidetes bacterium GWE2_40_63]OFY18439.1 MAG: hypothetical protein A2W88_19280 [Bacteroidetes bacterium GWF2_40_13]OFZ26434.1 MAG: hypot
MKKYWILTVAVVLVIVGLIVEHFYGNQCHSGEFARGYFAAGDFAIGVFAAGQFSIGIFSAGIFSVGIFSISIFNVGLYAVGFFVWGWKTKKPVFTTNEAQQTLKS